MTNSVLQEGVGKGDKGKGGVQGHKGLSVLVFGHWSWSCLGSLGILLLVLTANPSPNPTLTLP
jgi:hypothetical protein